MKFKDKYLIHCDLCKTTIGPFIVPTYDTPTYCKECADKHLEQCGNCGAFARPHDCETIEVLGTWFSYCPNCVDSLLTALHLAVRELS